MADKDSYRVQRSRVERIAKELAPNCRVEFSPDMTPDWIKFRIPTRRPAQFSRSLLAIGTPVRSRINQISGFETSSDN